MYQNVYYQREKNLIHLWDDVRGYSNFLILAMLTNGLQKVSMNPFMGIGLLKFISSPKMMLIYSNRMFMKQHEH